MVYRNFSHSIDLLKRLIIIQIGKMNYLDARWWGVNLNNGVKFQGKCYFKRFPGSKISIGKNCSFLSKSFSNQIGINRPCMLSTQTKNAQLIIGENCGFSGTVLGAFKLIKIGNNVRCGANTLITDSDWHNEDPRSGEPKAVIIEDNVWIGVNTIVLKGVTIGANSVIGAGSVVAKSIPANVVAAGNPCKIIRNI